MISMQSKCGSIVDVLTSINHDLDDYWLSKRNRISFDAYYPGQELVSSYYRHSYLLSQCFASCLKK